MIKYLLNVCFLCGCWREPIARQPEPSQATPTVQSARLLSRDDVLRRLNNIDVTFKQQFTAFQARFRELDAHNNMRTGRLLVNGQKARFDYNNSTNTGVSDTVIIAEGKISHFRHEKMEFLNAKAPSGLPAPLAFLDTNLLAKFPTIRGESNESRSVLSFSDRDISIELHVRADIPVKVIVSEPSSHRNRLLEFNLEDIHGVTDISDRPFSIDVNSKLLSKYRPSPLTDIPFSPWIPDL